MIFSADREFWIFAAKYPLNVLKIPTVPFSSRVPTRIITATKRINWHGFLVQ